MMQELFVAALFLYPGALIDLFYERCAKYAFKPQNQDWSARTAEYFFKSVIVTTISVLFYRFTTGAEFQTLGDLVSQLSILKEAILYIVISFFASALVAVVMYYAMGMNPRKETGVLQDRINGCTIVNSVNTWRELLYGKKYSDVIGCCIVRIRVGETTEAGFVSCYPEDFGNGITLIQTEAVKQQLELEKEWKPEERYIGDPYLEYFDPPSGAFVEFYKGDEFMEYLES